MERVNLIALGCVLVSSGLAQFSASADTILAPEPGRRQIAEDQYPESRFGQAPSAPEIGVRRGYALRAVEDMETSDEAVASTFSSAAGPSRRLAGLEMTGPGAAPKSEAPGRAFSPGVKIKEVDPVSTSSTIVRRGVQEVALIAGDLGYFPKTIFVTRDVPVRLFVTGASKNTLCIMMDSFQVRKQVRTQKIEEITFTPNTPGRFRFYCPVNGMEGTLIVKELASNTQQQNSTSGE